MASTLEAAERALSQKEGVPRESRAARLCFSLVTSFFRRLRNARFPCPRPTGELASSWSPNSLMLGTQVTFLHQFRWWASTANFPLAVLQQSSASASGAQTPSTSSQTEKAQMVHRGLLSLAVYFPSFLWALVLPP